MPYFTAGNGGPELADKFLRMMAGIDDAMILPEQFGAGVFRDRAKLVVYVGDPALGIGDRNDGMLVE
jgi:hypothetical protein